MKNIKPRFVIAVLAVLTLLLSACGSSTDTAAGGAPTKLVFVMPAPSVMQFHPWQIAEELGYFKEENVEVEIVAGDGSSSILQQILSGNADVGVPTPGATMLTASSGRDVVTFYQYLYTNIFTLAAAADSGITTVAQLRGKAVGVSDLAGGEVPLVRAALKEAGLIEGQDVTIIPVGEGGSLTLNALRQGQVQAYASSLFDEALVTAAGYPMIDILPENLQSFPANSVVTTSKVIAEKKPALIGMMRAVTKAILFTQTNPDAAIAIATKFAPEEFSDPKVVESGWAAITKLKTMPASIANDPRGTFIKESWDAYMKFLQQGTQEEGALQGPVDLDKLLDSSMLVDINNFDKDAVVKQAKEYSAAGS